MFPLIYIVATVLIIPGFVSVNVQLVLIVRDKFFSQQMLFLSLYVCVGFHVYVCAYTFEGGGPKFHIPKGLSI